MAEQNQSSSDDDQTESDQDQTSADRDQAASDRDQQSSDEDQKAADQDFAAGGSDAVHDRTSLARDRATADRDAASMARDEAAESRQGSADARDRAAALRDRAADARDALAREQDLSDDHASSLAGIRVRAEQARERAAADRARAAADRQLAARERAEALRIRAEAAEVVELAMTDRLTGARTREFGLEEVSRELYRAHRTGTRLVLCFVDVNGLKQVNDSRGHLAGDALLQLVGETLRACVRPYDVIVRYGGDELICAMTNLSVPQASDRFDQVAASLTAVDADHSISFGLAAAGPGDTLRELTARADANLLASRDSARRHP